MSGLISPLRDAAWFDAARGRNYPKVIALCYLPILIVGFYVLVLHDSQSDFAAFWAAARLSWRDPLAAWDFHQVAALQTWFPEDRWVPFVSPPQFLLLVAPFGLLPFGLAHALWFGLTFALYLLAGRGLLSGWTLAAFSPVLMVGIGGQTGLLTAALIIGAINLLERRPLLAGLLFGMLIIKPHLALLVPFALLAGRRWRAIAGAVAGSAGLLLLSYAAFGPESFEAFLRANSLSREVLTSGVHALKMQSVFSTVLALRGGIALASLTQAIAAGAVAYLVYRCWRAPGETLPKGAVLTAAIPLATPYVYGYDMALAVPALAWLIREGARNGFAPWEKLTIGAAFAAPLMAEPLARAGLGLNLGPLLQIVLLTLILRRLGAPPSGALAAERPATDGHTSSYG
ncbi:glycosyltransferase family 87 protein [Phenylobacterium sp. LjRoot219]|uniref:glycosyltransferase family 87 protein n=1 Tax=Phenylobacterium sp. LjRoot219 TaxID=3342283 RepID=UPI003ED0F59D